MTDQPIVKNITPATTSKSLSPSAVPFTPLTPTQAPVKETPPSIKPLPQLPPPTALPALPPNFSPQPGQRQTNLPQLPPTMQMPALGMALGGLMPGLPPSPMMQMPGMGLTSPQMAGMSGLNPFAGMMPNMQMPGIAPMGGFGAMPGLLPGSIPSTMPGMLPQQMFLSQMPNVGQQPMQFNQPMPLNVASLMGAAHPQGGVQTPMMLSPSVMPMQLSIPLQQSNPTPSAQPQSQTQIAPTPPAPPAVPRPTVVLLLGVCGGGKTIQGQKLAAEHNFMFFSGGETLRTFVETNKEWVRRRQASEALLKKLDILITPGCREKGIVIDRQGKSVEDMFYLNFILRSRKLQLNAIVYLETSNDEILRQRMSQRNSHEEARPEGQDEHAMNERIRATRSVMQRCIELFQQAHSSVMIRQIDCGRDEPIVLADIRSALATILSPPIQQRISNFSLALPVESPSLRFVEDVIEYGQVIDRLMALLQMDKNNKFPGTIVNNYVTRKFLDDCKSVQRDDYRIARRYVGSRFLYMKLKQEDRAYMIPRHMRCVYQVLPSLDNIAALDKRALAETGDVVLDGELVRISRRNPTQPGATKTVHETFFVSDTLVWNGVCVMRKPWDERQILIGEVLYTEGATPAFLSAGPPPLTYVQKRFYDVGNIAEAIKVGDYAGDGIVFQHRGEYRSNIDDKLHMWKPLTAITCDFRAGVVERTADNVKKVTLEVLMHEARDKARYVPFGEPIDIEPDQYRRQDVFFGSIVECSVLDATDPRKMKLRFVRVCADKTVASTRTQVEETLNPNNHIPAQKLIDMLAAASAPLPTGQFGLFLPRTQWGIAAEVKATPVTMGGPSKPPSMTKPKSTLQSTPPTSNITGDRWASLCPTDGVNWANTTPGTNTATTSEQKAVIQSVATAKELPGLVLGTAKETTNTPMDAQLLERSLAEKVRRATVCYQCSKETPKGRIDNADGNYYCYDCWLDLGFGACFSCNEFAKGARESRGSGKFYCNTCWAIWEEEGSSSKKERGQKREKGQPKENKPPVEKKGREDKPVEKKAEKKPVSPQIVPEAPPLEKTSTNEQVSVPTA